MLGLQYIRSIMVEGDWCILILAFIASDWMISILVVQTAHCFPKGPLRLLCCLIVIINASAISIPLSLSMLLGWSPWLAPLTPRGAATVWVVVKNLYLVSERIASDFFSMFWNCWGLSTSKPCRIRMVGSSYTLELKNRDKMKEGIAEGVLVQGYGVRGRVYTPHNP